MNLTKEAILAAKDTNIHSFEVEEWSGTILMRTMSGAARDKFEQTIAHEEDGRVDNIRALLLSLCICDEEGKLLFPSAADVEALGNKDGAVLDRLFKYAMGINGMNDGAVDDAEKN